MTNDKEYNNVHTFIIYMIIAMTLSSFSTNRDHPVQGVRRQVQRRPLRGHHMRGLQGESSVPQCPSVSPSVSLSVP